MYTSVVNKPVRAGVIPYTIAFNRVYFLMGVDRGTHELTDFGGGIKNGESPVQAALRELGEETCGLFGEHITVSHLERSKCVANYKSNAFIYFARVSVKWLYIAEEQFSKIPCKTEVVGVKWLTDEEFKHVIFNKQSQVLWKRVQNILRNTSWYDLVQNLHVEKITLCNNNGSTICN